MVLAVRIWIAMWIVSLVHDGLTYQSRMKYMRAMQGEVGEGLRAKEQKYGKMDPRLRLGLGIIANLAGWPVLLPIRIGFGIYSRRSRKPPACRYPRCMEGTGYCDEGRNCNN